MHGKWDFLLFGIDNSSRKTTNDDFHNNYIKAIMTVREMNWLTSQDFKKESAFIPKLFIWQWPKSEILALAAICKWYIILPEEYCALADIVHY